MRAWFLVILSLNLIASDFITLKEYSKMLYENPRGISCKKCHGANADEQILSYYYKDGVKLAYKIPNIQDVNFTVFKKALKEERDSKSLMPNYYLTDDEIVVLYNYIKSLKDAKN